jgi:hypothetical protein
MSSITSNIRDIGARASSRCRPILHAKTLSQVRELKGGSEPRFWVAIDAVLKLRL